ncbi:MAG: hypothetical protein QXF26_04395, partial [Candidatus Bathyarchaeia archaeon]
NLLDQPFCADIIQQGIRDPAHIPKLWPWSGSRKVYRCPLALELGIARTIHNLLVAVFGWARPE